MRIHSFEAGSYVARQMRGGAGEVELLDVLGRSDFETPFEFIKTGRLQPGVSVGLHRHERSEECLVVLDEPLTVAHNDHVAVLDPPALALCRAGDAHGIYNHGDTAASFIGIGVAPQTGEFDAVDLGDDLTGRRAGDPSLLGAEPLDPALLAPFRAHLGLGEIRFRRVFDHDVFATNWGFVDHALVPAGTSVGYHRHDTVQECYVIIRGRGRMKVDGESAEVSAGDCVPNRIGGSHGIVNHTGDPLEFLNIAVFMNKGQFDATDLGDDLSDLL
jgi:mannose-6-phosphate isomerase-like protein (cupin superfamily)